MSTSMIVAAWWTWIAGTALQLCLLVPVAVILDRLLARTARPSLQTALWCAVMARLVCPPSISASLPMPIVFNQTPLSALLGTPPSPSWTAALCAIWLAGASICATCAIWRHRRLNTQWLTGLDAPPAITARARCAAVRLGLPCVPRVLVHAQTIRPAVLGVFSPVVVLPASLTREATDIELEHVLLHELAHIRRRDPLRLVLCLGLQILYWFHPLVWMARVRLATLREIACDAAVVAIASRDEYRRTLLRLARPLAAPHVAGGVELFARHSELLARLAILDRPVAGASMPSRLHGLAAVLMFAVVLGGAVVFDSAAMGRLAPNDPDPRAFQGCLRFRFAVYAMLAEDAGTVEERQR